MERQDESTIGGSSTLALSQAGQSSHGGVVDQASRSRDQSSFPSPGPCVSPAVPVSVPQAPVPAGEATTVGDMASVIAELRAKLAARPVLPASGRPRGAIGVSRAVLRQRLDDRRRAVQGDAVRAARVEGQNGSQAPASVQRDRWGGSGGEREVQVRGRRRGGAASSASPSLRHAGTARAVSRSQSERRLRPPSRDGEENMRSPSHRGRTLLLGGKRLMRNREEANEGCSSTFSVSSRTAASGGPLSMSGRLIARSSRSPPCASGSVC